MHKVKQAEYIKDYTILLTFEDDKKKAVNFQQALDDFEGEIFKPLKDIDYFKNFKVSINTVVWPNGADASPDYLYKI